MDPKKLRLEAGQLVEQARAIDKTADNEKRSKAAEERTKCNTLLDQAEEKLAEAKQVERGASLRSQLDEHEGELEVRAADPAEGRRSLPGTPGGEGPEAPATERRAGGPLLIGGRDFRSDPRASDAYNVAFRSWLRGGGSEVRSLPEEVRAGLQSDVFTAGGALSPPIQFLQQLIQNVDDMVHIRGLATPHTVTEAQSLGVARLVTDPADADWTHELATGDETDIVVGGRELYPHPLAKEIKASKKTLRMVASSEGLIRERMAYKFGVTLEKAYCTADGVRKPLGIFTASPDGIPTTQDVSKSMAATNITADGLVEVKHTLKQQYWNRPNTRWFFSRELLKRARLLKDGDGRYLWQPGLSRDIPDRLLEIPYIVSEFAPNTFTANAYVAVLGDFSFYWTADALTYELERLDQLYAKTNQIGFIGRLETDGQPVLAEAFVRAKLAAA